jgi:hypothetical protein
MGLFQGEQASCGEVGIGPAELIDPSGSAFPFGLSFKDAAQPPTHIAIDALKDMGRTMLEELIPAFQRRIQIRAYGFHVSSTVAPALAPYGVFEFIEAFLAWPFPSPFKMVTQEVESSSLASIYYPRLGRVQFQSVLLYPLLDLFECLLGFFLAGTQYDEVVGVSHHFKTLAGHLPVQSIEVDI